MARKEAASNVKKAKISSNPPNLTQSTTDIHPIRYFLLVSSELSCFCYSFSFFIHQRSVPPSRSPEVDHSASPSLLQLFIFCCRSGLGRIVLCLGLFVSQTLMEITQFLILTEQLQTLCKPFTSFST